MCRRLVTTQPTYGGRRWWFLRPLARKDGGPPRNALNVEAAPLMPKKCAAF
jgi:hypothetical protein